MLNINDHQGNTNQNQNETLPHTCQKGYFQKIQQVIASIVKNMEKREPSYSIGGIYISVAT